MPSFAIKQAHTNDISTIIELQKKTWFPTYLPILAREQVEYMFELMYSESSLRDQIENLGHTFLLLYDNNSAIGFASFSPVEESNIFKIHKIYILTETQGTGAGRFLMAAVLKKCKEKGAEEIRLNVNRYNKARFFYEKMGFVILSEEDIPVGPYLMNDYIMGFNTKSLTI